MKAMLTDSTSGWKRVRMLARFVGWPVEITLVLTLAALYVTSRFYLKRETDEGRRKRDTDFLRCGYRRFTYSALGRDNV